MASHSVAHQGGNSDNGAPADGPTTAAAKDPIRNAPLERKIGETVGRKASRSVTPTITAGHNTKHQLQFLVGIALFGEEDAAEGIPLPASRRFEEATPRVTDLCYHSI